MLHENPSSYTDLIRFPNLITGQGSLTALEKSLLGHFILLARPKVLIELGVFRAATTRFLCNFLDENRLDALVIGFDLPDVISQLHQSDNQLVHYEQCGRLRLIPGRLPWSLAHWLQDVGELIGFALVDATHDYRSVTSELSLLWPRLSPNGYIICHDYSEKYEGVRYAVDWFSIRHNAMVLALSSSEQSRHAGHGSVLVAMCRRPYQWRFRRLMHHRWISARTSLLSNPAINKLWNRLLRPFVKRNNDGR